MKNSCCLHYTLQEFEGQPLPVEFGTDVVVTSAYAPMHAKYIFHAAARKNKNANSIKVCL